MSAATVLFVIGGRHGGTGLTRNAAETGLFASRDVVFPRPATVPGKEAAPSLRSALTGSIPGQRQDYPPGEGIAA